jgi:hypothetical protein
MDIFFQKKIEKYNKKIGGALETCTINALYNIIYNINNITTNFDNSNNNTEKEYIFNNNLENINIKNFENHVTQNYRPIKDDTKKYAVIEIDQDDGTTQNKIIPYYNTLCYAPSRGIIEYTNDGFLMNYDKINIGDIVRIWGMLELSGSISHLCAEIIISTGLSITFGMGYYGHIDGHKFDKLDGIIGSFIDRKISSLYSPDYLFNTKIMQQFNNPNAKYLKIISQGNLTKEQHSKLYNYFVKIDPIKDLQTLQLKTNQYNIISNNTQTNVKDVELYEKEHTIFDDLLKSTNNLDDTKFSKNVNKIEQYKNYKKKYNKIVKIVDKIYTYNKDIYIKTGIKLEKLFDTGDPEQTDNAKLLFNYNSSNIYSIYLSYYWKNPDRDYCTISGPIVSAIHNKLNKKPVTNCTAFITDFFSDIIRCVRFDSGIVDPNKCSQTNEKNECDKTGIPIQ